MGDYGSSWEFMGQILKKGGCAVAFLNGKELRKFDQANRMTLPPKYRMGLGDDIVIMKSIHKEPCLMLFSSEGWDNFMDIVISSFDGAKQADAERRLANRSDSLIPDKSNRIFIKDDFKAYASLGDEVLAVGMTDRVELWNPSTWEEWYGAETEEADDDFFENVPYTRARGK